MSDTRSDQIAKDCLYDDAGDFCYTHETNINSDGSCPGPDPINGYTVTSANAARERFERHDNKPTEHRYTSGGIADITRELLTVDLDRLSRDHYSDEINSSCDGCRRAALIAAKLRDGISFNAPQSPRAAAISAGMTAANARRRVRDGRVVGE